MPAIAAIAALGLGRVRIQAIPEINSASNPASEAIAKSASPSLKSHQPHRVPGPERSNDRSARTAKITPAIVMRKVYRCGVSYQAYKRKVWFQKVALASLRQ